jgi:hypothetical protein
MTGFAQIRHRIDLLNPIRQWLNAVEIRSPEMAKWICQVIPSQCPFARSIKFWGDHTLHIPPLCKLNPLYEELIELRFRALCYLADECNQDITAYI